MNQPPRIAGLVLAGGRSVRFGGEKAVARHYGRTLLEIACGRLQPACDLVAVSAAPGSETEQLSASLGLVVVHDAEGAPRGPLSGVCAGLSWAQSAGAELLATLPCDLPLAPSDLVLRLAQAIGPEDGAAVARTDDGLQSLCMVVRTALQPALAEILARHEHPAVHEWLADVRAREVAFEDAAGFLNVNTPQDWRRLEDRTTDGAGKLR